MRPLTQNLLANVLKEMERHGSRKLRAAIVIQLRF